jgi:hypothetical protein
MTTSIDFSFVVAAMRHADKLLVASDPAQSKEVEKQRIVVDAVAEVKRLHDAAVADAQARLEGELRERLDRLRAERADVAKREEARIFKEVEDEVEVLKARLKKEHEASIDAERRKFEDERDALRRRHDDLRKKLSAEEADFETSLRASRDVSLRPNADEVEKRRGEIERMRREEEARLGADLEALRRRFDDELRRGRERYDAQIVERTKVGGGGGGH